MLARAIIHMNIGWEKDISKKGRFEEMIRWIMND
jgi:hypothetical protein